MGRGRKNVIIFCLLLLSGESAWAIHSPLVDDAKFCAYSLSLIQRFRGELDKIKSLETEFKGNQGAYSLAELLFDAQFQNFVSLDPIPEVYQDDRKALLQEVGQIAQRYDERQASKKVQMSALAFALKSRMTLSKQGMRQNGRTFEALGDIVLIPTPVVTVSRQERIEKAIEYYRYAQSSFCTSEDRERIGEKIANLNQEIRGSKAFVAQMLNQTSNLLAAFHPYDLEANLSITEGITEHLISYLNRSDIYEIHNRGDLAKVFQFASHRVRALVMVKEFGEAFKLLGALASSAIYLPPELLRNYKAYWNMAWEDSNLQSRKVRSDLLSAAKPESWGEHFLVASLRAASGNHRSAFQFLGESERSLLKLEGSSSVHPATFGTIRMHLSSKVKP